MSAEKQMRKFIEGGPAQLVEAVEACQGYSPPSGRKFERVLLLGMGGSALSGGLVDMVRKSQRCSWGFEVVRDYSLPYVPDDATLVLALSYSGETEETLAAFDAAWETCGHMVAISSGGKLKERALRHGVTWLRVPPKPRYFQPRFALYFMFAAVFEILCRCGLLEKDIDLRELAASLSEMDQEQQGREIAARLAGRIPIIYTFPWYEQSVARIWKIKLNENSKTCALWGAIPEINHNELVTYRPEEAGKFAFVFIPDPDGDARIARRFELMRSFLVERGYEVLTVPLVGSSPVEKCLVSLKLADWVSYHLALANNIDPIAIAAIQEFKRDLRDGASKRPARFPQGPCGRPRPETQPRS